MGACISTKKHSSSSSLNNVPLSAVIKWAKGDSQELKIERNLVTEEAEKVKKEIFVIKHRKSHDRERPRPSASVEEGEEKTVSVSGSAVTNTNSSENGGSTVRTSSCTKEEVEAILIRCGRLSRNNSSGTPPTKARKYAGSKRSYDLDNDQYNPAENEAEDDEMGATTRQYRHSSPSQGRRRTPSRERERGNSSGRRVSRSPGRRSETAPSSNSNTRPEKMVSVPATVSAATTNDGAETQTTIGIKRVFVKRNVGEAVGLRSAGSPRSRSPVARVIARVGSNENSQLMADHSNTRKAEQSPYRRNPLSEIDPNSLKYAQTTGNFKANNGTTPAQTKNPEAEQVTVVKEVVNQKPNAEISNNKISSQGMNNKVVEVGEAKSVPQTLTRSRSARRSRSRDFDFNPDTLMNTNPSYTSLLLEDIQNFHQKNTTTNTSTNAPSFTVPACLSKACSILEAVADLHSTTSSNLSKVKDPFVGSDLVVSDDLMEPSLHKYVTVMRGGNGEDMDRQESSGSNSFVGWGYSTSSWEPNSADSTGRWTSRSNTREDDERSPLGFQKHTITEMGHNMVESRRGFSGQRTGIGRRVDSSKNLHSTLVAATT